MERPAADVEEGWNSIEWHPPPLFTTIWGVSNGGNEANEFGKTEQEEDDEGLVKEQFEEATAAAAVKQRSRVVKETCG